MQKCVFALKSHFLGMRMHLAQYFRNGRKGAAGLKCRRKGAASLQGLKFGPVAFCLVNMVLFGYMAKNGLKVK